MKEKIQELAQKLKELPQGTATLIFLAAMFLVHLLLSYQYLFIPTEQLTKYGFLPNSPLTLLSYSFLHLSPQHLLANVGLLLAVGIIAEKKLDFKDYSFIFFTSAISAAIVFQILSKEPTVLVGASSAISGILAASVFVDFKKAIPAIIIFGVLLQFASPMVTSHTQQKLANLENKTKDIQKEYNETQKKINQTEQELKEKQSDKGSLSYKCSVLNITSACEKLKEIKESIKEEEQQKQELEEKKNKTLKNFTETTEEEQQVKEGIEREEKAETSAIVHLVGAVTGIAYIGAFRRDIIWNLTSQASQLAGLFKR